MIDENTRTASFLIAAKPLGTPSTIEEYEDGENDEGKDTTHDTTSH